MCTVVLSIEPGLPVLAAGVRDELHDRAWEPPGRHWPQYGGLIGGRDLLAGGTWLAVSPDDLRVACVLNGIGRPTPAATRRSRGVLPLAAAAGEPPDRGMLADLDPFLLVVAEPDRAFVQSWDGRDLAERPLPGGLHMIVNTGLASQASGEDRPRALLTGRISAGTEPTAAQPTTGQPTTAQPTTAPPPTGPPPDGREHESARVGHFLRRFGSAARPDPRPGVPVAAAWGDWFPLVNGDGIRPDDKRALIVRRDLGDGRTWGTTSISLVALAPGRLRYDFTGRPGAGLLGDQAAWHSVL